MFIASHLKSCCIHLHAASAYDDWTYEHEDPGWSFTHLPMLQRRYAHRASFDVAF